MKHVSVDQLAPAFVSIPRARTRVAAQQTAGWSPPVVWTVTVPFPFV